MHWQEVGHHLSISRSQRTQDKQKDWKALWAMLTRHKSHAVILVTTALLSGCYFPEKFETKITINPDASYNLKFDGVVAHIMAAVQVFQTKKPLNAKEEDALKAEALKISKSPGVIKASYAGNGRYNITFNENVKPGQKLDMLGMFNVSTDKDGVMTITSAVINDQAKGQIKELGLTISGKLEVVLPKNAVILSSNATSSPTFFGMFGSYSWNIGSIEQAPLMRIRFNK